MLDIQKEEAERTRSHREAAEQAAAAAGLPVSSPSAGGWAKIAGGGTASGPGDLTLLPESPWPVQGPECCEKGFKSLLGTSAA